jgi:hypothetical protein
MAIELELAKYLKEEEVKYAEIPNYCDVKCLADGISYLMVSL